MLILQDVADSNCNIHKIVDNYNKVQLVDNTNDEIIRCVCYAQMHRITVAACYIVIRIL